VGAEDVWTVSRHGADMRPQARMRASKAGVSTVGGARFARSARPRRARIIAGQRLGACHTRR
jgi:hypothetical protein